jgi:hypothetical protein
LSNFSELTDYKNNIIFKLISNENLVKAIYNTDRSFLSQSLPENFDTTSLVYDSIFPYSYIPNITTSPKTFITMSFINFKYINNVFKSGILNFNILSHHSLMSTDYGLRTDYILKEIDLLFNKQHDVGAFNLELYSGGDFIINENYYGMSINYKFYDFQ